MRQLGRPSGGQRLRQVQARGGRREGGQRPQQQMVSNSPGYLSWRRIPIRLKSVNYPIIWYTVNSKSIGP